ncbi:MAG: hypothetical protein L0Y39_10775 [Methylococcaceae bacterium]|nr:hypothetical protein [Methylococcaceae bacterium]
MEKHQIDTLIRLVGHTKDDEIDCEHVSRVAEFAERELQGKSAAEGLAAVEHPLAICPECREAYEVLQRALRAMDH